MTNAIVRRKAGSSGGGGIGGIIGGIIGAGAGALAGNPLAGAQMGYQAGGLIGGAAKPAEAPINSSQDGSNPLDKISKLGGMGLSGANMAQGFGGGESAAPMGELPSYGAPSLGVDTNLNAFTRRRRFF